MRKSIATLTVLVLALSVGIAGAATSYPTHFKTFKPEGTSPAVKGEIDSPKTKCVKNRTIKVFKKGEEGKVASGKTNSKGKFEITIYGEVVGPYYGKVKKATLDSGKVCLGAKSETAIL